MKKTILLVLVLALGLATEVANADFTFGEPVNLGPPVNTPSREVSFFISTDGLEMYVSSERSGGLGYVDMWCSTRENADNPWGPLVNVQEINSRYNEAFPCLSADGLTLYFSDWYAWNPAGDRPGGVGNHDLWMCTRASRNDPWGTPVNTGAPLNSGSPDISPTISHDGLTFIFASTRSGGLGNFDLWMSTRPAEESDWAAPVNMGPPVNSSAYDGEVCLSTDGLALFFCSNRPGGMGSYDMWLTTRRSQAAAWNPPVNLGPVINTSGMEGAPSLSPDLKTLCFCSDQPGGIGGWDMYGVPIVPILDFNGDGIVDSADMCIMVDHWGEDYSLCDIGPMPWGDGIVDVQDLIVLAEHLFEEVLPIELVAYWKLDEVEGDIAYNSIGDNHGILSGNPTWQPDSGQVAGTLEFDGIDDYVETGFVLNPADGAFSVFAWIKGGAPGQIIISQADALVGRTLAPGSTLLGIDSSEGTLMTGLMQPQSSSLVSESVINDTQWHHIGLVYKLAGWKRYLYVDGIEVAVDTDYVTGAGCDASLYIGAGQYLNASTFFSGLIDDVRIYNVALTAEEIAAMTQ